MSNIKEVVIEGKLPFNLGDGEEVAKWVGYLHAPSMGFKFEWGSCQMWPNIWGGSTSMHTYSITGQEAVSDAWIEKLVKEFSKEGPVTACKVRDVENNTEWFDAVGWTTDEYKKNFIQL